MYLTDIELMQDGVQRVGYKDYLIPCEICGRKIRRTQYSRKRTYICDYCKGVISKKEKASIPENLQNVQTKKEKMFEQAVNRIKAQVADFESYAKAIKAAKTRCEDYGSIPEAMVAIELLQLHHKIIPQQKIGKYKVDFAVTDIKTVVEVDGSVYHKTVNNEREAIIQLSLGVDWQIVHIPAELIAKDIQKLSKVLDLYT